MRCSTKIPRILEAPKQPRRGIEDMTKTLDSGIFNEPLGVKAQK